MPLPAILAGAASVLAAAIVVDDLLTGGRVADKVGKKAAQAVLDARGIPLNLDGDVNSQTITIAINKAVMPDGIEFENLFNKHAVARDLKRIALEHAGEAFGFEGDIDVATLRQQIMTEVTNEVISEIQAGAGDFIDAAKPLVKVQELLDRPPPKSWNTPSDFSAKGVSNRLRQKKYRQRHTRVWVEK